MDYGKRPREDQWERISDLLPGRAGDAGRHGRDNRQFVEAVVWIGVNGAPWRSLPREYGKWSTAHKRFVRWSRKGVWQKVFDSLAAQGADTEWLMIDATVIRAHQHATGARG